MMDSPRRLLATVLAACLGVAAASSVEAASPPTRIVSLNLCTDQILLGLVPRARIAALSHLAADPTVSAAAEIARGIPATRGDAETVLAFDPDLVLAGEWSTPATVSLLERLGRRIVKVPLAADVPAIAAAIRGVAEAVRATEAGERLVDELTRRIATAAARHPQRPAAEQPAALVYQVNGLASGPGSLADALMREAGLANHARRLGLGAGGTVALEAIVSDPPDLVVLTGPVDEYRTAVADNLRHPALAAVMRKHAAAVVPWRYWLCGTQHAATAVELLAAARAAIGTAHSNGRTPR